MEVVAQPAEAFDEVSSALGDLLGELHHVDASEDDVIGHHRVRAREGRTRERDGSHGNQ